MPSSFQSNRGGGGGELFLQSLDKLGGWFGTLLSSLKVASPASKVTNDQPLRSLIIPNKELPSWLNETLNGALIM